MINPQTLTEQMLFNTLRIENSKGGTGTGFFLEFDYGGEDKKVPVIITNKHVINDNPQEEVFFFIHIKTNEGPSDENIGIKIKPQWFFHPEQDLCFCLVAPLDAMIKKEFQKAPYFISISENSIWDNKRLEDLSALEDVVMVGYPKGLRDTKNNLPLFRKGITASHPAIDFNNKNIGAVDMACFPGSS